LQVEQQQQNSGGIPISAIFWQFTAALYLSPFLSFFGILR
jgi:hypothetical protein